MVMSKKLVYSEFSKPPLKFKGGNYLPEALGDHPPFAPSI